MITFSEVCLHARLPRVCFKGIKGAGPQTTLEIWDTLCSNWGTRGRKCRYDHRALKRGVSNVELPCAILCQILGFDGCFKDLKVASAQNSYSSNTFYLNVPCFIAVYIPLKIYALAASWALLVCPSQASRRFPTGPRSPRCTSTESLWAAATSCCRCTRTETWWRSLRSWEFSRSCWTPRRTPSRDSFRTWQRTHPDTGFRRLQTHTTFFRHSFMTCMIYFDMGRFITFKG